METHTCHIFSEKLTPPHAELEDV